MENEVNNFFGLEFSDEIHPLDKAVNFWIDRNHNYKKLLIEGRLVPPFIQIAKLCVRDKTFQEEHAEFYVDGWVLFSKGMFNGDFDLIAKAESLMKPMMDRIIKYLTSDLFKKHVLSQYVTGEEKLPIIIPEIFITVNELLLYSNKKREIFITPDQVDILKQGFVFDKMKGWGILDEFGNKLKLLEPFLYPEVFNPNGFLIFDYLMKSQDFIKRGAGEDIAYFFHQMTRDEFIHAGRDFFKKWVNKHYRPFRTIEKIHDERSRIPAKRKERYLEALAFIKSKKD